jgi:hypothetical protein
MALIVAYLDVVAVVGADGRMRQRGQPGFDTQG